MGGMSKKICLILCLMLLFFIGFAAAESVTTKVICVFKDSNNPQTCGHDSWRSPGNGCTGIGSCSFTIKGEKYTRYSLRSTCLDNSGNWITGNGETQTFTLNCAITEKPAPVPVPTNPQETRLTELVYCSFIGSEIPQYCYPDTEAKGCTDTTQCKTQITGQEGKKINWKSTCGGYASTIIDGKDETITFNCESNIREEITCGFKNANGEQKCYAASDSTGAAVNYSCSGSGKEKASCVIQVAGTKGATITWKSSCGGEQYSTIDGIPNYLEFDCAGAKPEKIREEVKCLFKNSKEKQKCYAFHENQTFSCATEKNNLESCAAYVSALKGTKLIWKSSCGGYAYTIVDGENEYARFDCTSSEPEPCACTKEYKPVCGAIKICTTNCASNPSSTNESASCTNSCSEERKIFSNSCEAKCAGAEIISEGACEKPCPTYARPECNNGKIEMVYDERGCEKPRCVKEETEHYTGAYWQCSNEKEFKEAGECKPYAYWKEKARRTCAQFSAKCAPQRPAPTASSSTSTETASTTTEQEIVNPTTESIPVTSGGESSESTPATGNFLLEMINTVIARPIKCVDGKVIVERFEAFGNCSPGQEKCKYYVDEKGCKIRDCVDGTKEKACPSTPSPEANAYRKAYWQCYSGKEFFEGGEQSCKTSEVWAKYAREACEKECNTIETTCPVDSNECSTSTAKCGVNSFQLSDPCYDGTPVICSNQSEEVIRALKERCYKNNLELEVEFDSKGCREYKCAKETPTCRTKNDIPKEKKISCEERGGQLAIRVDDRGCLTYLECIGEKIKDKNAVINKELITDKMKLLELAIKIETAKIELEQTAHKIREIARYYSSQNKNADANRFHKAANILEAAAQKLDEIKLEIKNNVDNFTEEKTLRIRDLIRNIKEELLKEALLGMLG